MVVADVAKFDIGLGCSCATGTQCALLKISHLNGTKNAKENYFMEAEMGERLGQAMSARHSVWCAMS